MHSMIGNLLKHGSHVSYGYEKACWRVRIFSEISLYTSKDFRYFFQKSHGNID